MKTNANANPKWELTNSQRYVRGMIGAATLLAVLLIPGLSEGWLFLLTIIGAYESLTAILNADLIYDVLSLINEEEPEISHEESEAKGASALLVATAGQRDYPMVA